MAILKCKMCGGDLAIQKDSSIAECEYCGTKQTVPTTNDEEVKNLFNRANILRRKCEFDKAEQLYEKILLKDDKQAEAYWCVLLCRYGIEYVEDPQTFKRVPTCHRASYEAFTADEYYKLALEKADSAQRRIYEEEAKYIDEVQKQILALSQKEKPYDVFICYKETDENGKRTQDSVIANDIYHQLTQEGYKVFYAAITLEDKLGSAYEPVIFAALNSSKVMLAIGTKSEYFNAVWVKNEWSRFLKMMKNDRSKMLIPCYRDMDAYELPEEFAHLQAQDMSKIGFIQDVIRGIKKIIVTTDEKAETKSAEVVGAVSGSVKSLLKRAFMFAEDGDFENAESYAEKVLDIDPECAEAYLVKFMCELEVNARADLGEHDIYEYSGNNYDKLMKFADSVLKAEIAGYYQAAKEPTYQAACKRLEEAGGYLDEIETAMNIFYELKNYKDSSAKIEECSEKLMEIPYNEACKILKTTTSIDEIKSAISMFSELGDYKSSKSNIVECEKKIADLKKEATYVSACKIMKTAWSITEYQNVISTFEKIADYKDSAAKIDYCKAKIEDRNIQAEQQAEIDKKRNKRKKIIIASVAVALAAIIAIIVTIVMVSNVKKTERVTQQLYGTTWTYSSNWVLAFSGGKHAWQIDFYEDGTCKIGHGAFTGTGETTSCNWEVKTSISSVEIHLSGDFSTYYYAETYTVRMDQEGNIVRLIGRLENYSGSSILSFEPQN